MLFYKDYNSFIYFLNIKEKVHFFYNRFKQWTSIIQLLIHRIKIKYTILPSIDNNIIFSNNKLFFNNLFFNTFFNNNKNTKYNTYFLNIKITLLFNNHYYTLINIMNNTFYKKIYMEKTRSHINFLKQITIHNNNIYKVFNNVFLQLKKIKPMCYIYFFFNTNNYFFNKLILSHLFINI